ncbi:MAG: DUF2330 domain-containing protein, partial [Anaerolineae bacterium]|nr:DUF2330 domain-containing protein [Anaerolineae bacterium]
TAVVCAALALVTSVSACGGLFCQNIPVDQQAERIIFTVNDNGTITAYVQINYTGSAPDFSWVVPVPSVPEVDVAEIATFDELSRLTAPVFIPPLMPECAVIPVPAAMAGASDGSVEVLASGVAGPYAYDVVTSPDPTELIIWLRTNNYIITEAMEPLVKVYTDEGMVFLAMKLQPDQGAQDIQPVVMTYESTQPMIPLRLTAVAANPNMNVLTWILGETQALPTNYANPTISDDDLRYSFGSSDGTNYLALIDQTVDLYSGRAFITEYAGPTSALVNAAVDPLAADLLTRYPYITRVFGRISPEEMTVDPVFKLSDDVADVSNVRDLSGMDAKTFWACEGTEQNVQVEYDPNVVPPDFE